MSQLVEYLKENWMGWLFAAISTGLSLSLRHLYAQAKKEAEERALIKEGILALLHDNLYRVCRYHLAEKKITISQLKNVEYLYTSYHDLGGNGTGTELYDRVRRLPVEEELEEN